MPDKAVRESADLSPLDQVRQAEAEVARRIAAARDAASRKINSAREEAARIRNAGRQKGEQSGQALYREILKKAQEDAEGMCAQARSQAEQLRQRGIQLMPAAVEHILKILLDLEEDSTI